MKSVLKGVGCAAVLGAALLALSSPAEAETVQQQFLFAVRNGAHVQGSDPLILQTGNWVCWQLGPGKVDPPQVIANVRANHPDLTYVTAHDFVVETYQLYCPDQADWDQYWAYGTDASGGGGG
jgi:hypothetical protein